ncbi:MAG: 3-deoxy-7-phosphoheptulonate synthase [Actinomycetota bacterium]|nr:3-deoxy-7-phosphoheptulonate synthase [Actinomycetota bacterium]
MIIVMHPDASSDEIDQVVARLEALGADVQVTTEEGRTIVNGTTESRLNDEAPWGLLPGVDRIVPEIAGGRRVGRQHKAADTVVDVSGVLIGDGTFTVAAGPCAVESRNRLMEVAAAVKAAGAHMLRGDAFKPRTSPYSFQGLGKAGLEMLSEARDTYGLPVVAEVLDPRDVDLVAAHVDMLRIGTRNMSNYVLLKEVGRQGKPVQLKRGRASTIGEWIDAAEYIFNEGNRSVVMVERGVRGFDNTARNILDISAVPIVKAMTHLPVMVDPSHAAGRKDLVAPLALAAVAAGADGLLIDVHTEPGEALVDGAQALAPSEFERLMTQMRAVKNALREA